MPKTETTITIEVTHNTGVVEVIDNVVGVDVFRSDDDRPRIFVDREGSVCPARKPTVERVGYDPIEGVIIPRETKRSQGAK